MLSGIVPKISTIVYALYIVAPIVFAFVPRLSTNFLFSSLILKKRLLYESVSAEVTAISKSIVLCSYVKCAVTSADHSFVTQF